MKKHFLLALILPLLLALPLRAQTGITNLPPDLSPQQNFFSTIGGYFTSFSDLTTFQHTNDIEVSLGMDYQNNVNFASSLTLEYNIKGGISAETVTRNAGIAGLIVSEQVGAGYSAVMKDTKFTGYLDLGYDFNRRAPYAALGARVKKALTENTFAGIGLEVPVYFTGKSQLSPTVTVFTGFRF